MREGHDAVMPEEGAAVDAVIEEGTRRRFREARSAGTPEPQEAYAADAFVDAVLGGPKSKKSGGYSAHILIDHEVLKRGYALPGETCEIAGIGPVNVEWVREVLGDAFVTAIVKKGKDITTVAHFGRHIPAHLRTAMTVSGRECSIEGCTGREHLELDHCEIDHAKGGPTARWNLAWLCSVHHKRKTKGWKLGPPDPETGKRKLEPRPGARVRYEAGGVAVELDDLADTAAPICSASQRPTRSEPAGV